MQLLAAGTASAAKTVVDNLTGLPAYPNLDLAVMEPALQVEALGRQCVRFVGQTSDSLEAVKTWYRKRLARASETDLTNDELYRGYERLSGIKLALGVDYVAIFIAAKQRTMIELHRCAWNVSG